MNRVLSREEAVKLIYQMEITKDSPKEAIENFIENCEIKLESIDLEYIKGIVNGVCENKEEIDSVLQRNFVKWKIDRISKVNLAILRVGLYEMNYVEEVPGKVAINEAVEVAKKYSDEKSVAFINGVLDKIYKEN